MAPMDDGRQERTKPLGRGHQRLRVKRTGGYEGLRHERKATLNPTTAFLNADGRFHSRVRDEEDNDDDDGDDGTVTTNAKSFNRIQNNYDDESYGSSADPHDHAPPAQIFRSQSTSATTISTSTTSPRLSGYFPSLTKTIPLMVPTFFPTTISLPTTSTTSLLAAFTSTQYQKDLETVPSVESSTTSSTTTRTAVTPIALAESSAPTDTRQPGYHHSKHDRMKPLGRNLLVATGTIGAFIIVITTVYLILRLGKSNMLRKLRSRRLRRGGRNGWYGWRSIDDDSFDPPPQYTGPDEYYGKNAAEKSIPAQRQLDAFFSPIVTPRLATTNASLSRADSQRQNLVREALLDSPGPFGYGAAPQQHQHQLSAMEAFYVHSSQSEAETPRVQLSRQVSDAQCNTLNTQTSTQNAIISQNVSNSDGPRETKYMSYLSSLSSGFGDGLIIPEDSIAPEANLNANTRASRRQSRSSYLNRFSWATSGNQLSQGDRDTIYTTTSVDSAPRFRTINSWVAQQSSQWDKKRLGDKAVPKMPTVPLPLRIAANQRRETVENPAFQFHPGDELIISRGSRVPSEILDKKLLRR